jgi:hypothetical protein
LNKEQSSEWVHPKCAAQPRTHTTRRWAISEPEHQSPTVEERVAALEDELAVRDLLARYSFCADLRLADEWVDLWTADGVYDLGDANVSSYGGRWQGHESLRRLLTGAGMPPAGRAQHYTNGPQVVRIHGDEAVVENYSLTLVQDDDGRVAPWATGFNRWTLVRAGGRWRIRERIRREVGSPGAEKVLGATLSVPR